MYTFSSARELFEAARGASRDAGRIRTQLLELEARASKLGGGGFEPRVRSTSDPTRMAAGVAALVDREQELQARQDEDYRLIDAACAMLYGPDGRGGLAKIVPTWWADVLWWRYLDGATWEDTGRAVGYSPRQCYNIAGAALKAADRDRHIWATAGIRRRERD